MEQQYPAKLEKHPKVSQFNLDDPRFNLRNRLSYFHDDEFPLLMHSHDFFELNIVCEGSGRHYIADNSFPFSAGAVFVIPPHVEHGYWAVDNKARIFHLLIEEKFLTKNLYKLNSFPGYRLLFETEPELRTRTDLASFFLELTPSQLSEKMPIFRRLVHLAKGNRSPVLFDEYALVLLCDLSYLYERIYRSTDHFSAKRGYANIVRSVNYLLEHIGEPLGLDDLSAVAIESRTSYINKFKLLFKTTPFEYLRQARINKASEMLSTTNEPIYVIAKVCGFTDSAHFVKVFKEKTGLTPLKYRTEKMTDENYHMIKRKNKNGKENEMFYGEEEENL